ncbi:hypothetical protein AGMMS50268_31700 [Spirochaetia bacterium]|nr:hypothetical protein AGMMS50268_31700 [Spirochaetia bacterium]
MNRRLKTTGKEFEGHQFFDDALRCLVLGHDANANLLEILYNRIDEKDQVSIAWLRTMAEKTHKTPTEIIGELVREKISTS